MTIQFGDDVRASVSMLYRGADTFMNIFHFSAGVGVNVADSLMISAVGAALLAAYNQIAANTSAELAGSEIEFYKRDPTSGDWDGIGSYDFTGWSGGSASDELPSGVCAVLRFFADGTGFQGRKFVGSLLEGSTTDGVWSGAILTALAAFCTSVTTNVAVAGGNMEPGWWSEADGQEYEYNGTFIINTVPGYQRRRKQGIGI